MKRDSPVKRRLTSNFSYKILIHFSLPYTSQWTNKTQHRYNENVVQQYFAHTENAHKHGKPKTVSIFNYAGYERSTQRIKQAGDKISGFPRGALMTRARSLARSGFMKFYSAGFTCAECASFSLIKVFFRCTRLVFRRKFLELPGIYTCSSAP